MPLLATGLAVTLAACGGPSSGSTASGGTGPSLSAGWDINETPRDQLTGGEFVGVSGTKISTWNTFSVAGNNQEIVFLEARSAPPTTTSMARATPS